MSTREDAAEGILSVNRSDDSESVIRAVLVARHSGMEPWEIESMLSPGAFLAACECCYEGWDPDCPIHGRLDPDVGDKP